MQRTSSLLMEDMLEDLERRYPFLLREAVDYYEIDNAELFLELRDGSKYIFDFIGKSFRKVRPVIYNTDYDDKVNFRKEFAIRLRSKIAQAGFTQQTLSEKTGISQPNISRYVSGTALPDAHNLIKIAQALNYDINEFYRLPK